MDDTQLIRRYVAEGSEAAFSELVGRYLGLVHSAAIRQVGGDFHRAKDVTQKVFTLLARKAPSLTRHPALTAWLYAATHFEASTVMRGERRRQFREEEALSYMNELLANLEPEVDWDQLKPVLDGAMLELQRKKTARLLLVALFSDAPSHRSPGPEIGGERTCRQKTGGTGTRQNARLARQARGEVNNSGPGADAGRPCGGLSAGRIGGKR